MLTFTIFKAFSETKIDNVNTIARRLSSTNQKVIRLDIAMDDALPVDLLDALNHLVTDHEHGLQIEIPLASLEEVFD